LATKSPPVVGMTNIQSPKPLEWVSRVIAAVGVEVTDKDAYWLGFHMERFLAYCRKHAALLDLATAVAAYKVFLQQLECGNEGVKE